MGARVVGVDALGVDVAAEDGTRSRIEAHTTIWAAGVQASPLAAKLAEASGAELDRAGRIAVLPDLTIPGHPEVFAVGDMAALDNLPAWPRSPCRAGSTPPTPSCDGSGARPACRSGTATSASWPPSAGSGPSPAFGKVRLSGFPAWVVWFFVHLAFLSGFGNRATTMVRWLRSMIGRGRAEREFSTAHTGGDLSLPDAIRAEVEPVLFPNAELAREPKVVPSSSTR